MSLVDPQTIDAATERGARAVTTVKALWFGDPSTVQSTAVPREASKAIDPFESVAGDIIEPPIDLLRLAKLPGLSVELGPCIAAMATNVDGFGYDLVPFADVDGKGASEEILRVIKMERLQIESFLAKAVRGTWPRISFTQLRKRTREDLEATGNAWWEIIESRLGKLVGFKHLRAAQVRIAKSVGDLVQIEVPTLEVQADGTRRLDSYIDYVRFKRFVQGTIDGAASAVRWFKEFGDPRILDSQTGRYVPREEAERSFERSGKPMPDERKAGSLYHFSLYSGWTPYGLPRYYGAILALLGARSGEEVSYVTLNNNGVPSLLLTVSGGRLTKATLDRVAQYVEANIKGTLNYSQILLLEGESGEEGDESNHVKIEVTPLSKFQHTEQLFSGYVEGGNEAVRRSFRISGIFTGHMKDVTRATGETARRLADEQVFAPERNDFDWMFTNEFFPRLGFVHHQLVSHTPNITDNLELVAMAATTERNGAMTPRRADRIVRDIFPNAAKVPLDGSKYDLDVPFSMTMAERIKNQALPTEVGQQVAPVTPTERPTLVKILKESLEADAPVALALAERLTAEDDATS